MKFGVISLTRNEKDLLMWAYYSQNKGFAIKLNINKLNNNWFGPFPINYVSKLSKIEFNEYSPAMNLFYQTNVKEIIWKKEDEWRYLTYNPYGNYLPYFNKKNYKTRFEYYNQNAVEQIILGYDFFEPNTIKKAGNYDIMRLRPKSQEYKIKRLLLNYIITQNLKVGQILRNNE